MLPIARVVAMETRDGAARRASAQVWSRAWSRTVMLGRKAARTAALASTNRRHARRALEERKFLGSVHEVSMMETTLSGGGYHPPTFSRQSLTARFRATVWASTPALGASHILKHDKSPARVVEGTGDASVRLRR